VSDARFKGYLDDCCVFNYALSAEDVAKLYNGELPTGLYAAQSHKPKEEGISPIYDISGKRLNTPQKGINIINGMKIIY
jgi:hypothetical protein